MVARNPPLTLPGLIAAKVLESPLAALLWVLIDGGLPVVVAGEGPRPIRTAVLAALAQVRPDREIWPDDLAGAKAAAAPDVGDSGDAEQVRRFLLLARDGRTLGATMEATDLEDVFRRLGAPPVGLRRDELGHLGIVVVLDTGTSTGDEASGAAERITDAPDRIVAVHWVRPLSRDVHEHVQRLPPAVLGTRDAATGRWEDFSWGVLPDLAARIGRRPGELETERDARAVLLDSLAEAGILEPPAVASAIEAFSIGRADTSRELT